MQYLLLVNLAFTAFFLLYVLVLKRLTFFGWNRVYLLFSLFFSLALPFLAFDPLFFSGAVLPVVTLPELILRPDSAPVLKPVIVTVAWVYWVGAIIAALVVFRSLWTLFQMARSSSREQNAHASYFVNEGHHAFSFFQRIQVGKAIDPEIREMVLQHELVHQREWHSVDVLCYAIARVLFWFNPFIHLAAREVQLNHEFLADRHTVARFGTDYQHSLLNQAFETKIFPLTNSFFSTSLIKNRILMMNRKNNRKWSAFAYALALPLIAGSLWLSSCSEQAGLPDGQQKAMNMKDAMTAQKTDYNSSEVDEVPQFEGGQEGLLAYFQEGFKYPENLKENEIEGRVVIAFTVLEDGAITNVEALESDHELLNEPAIAFVKNMPNWTPGKKDGKTVKVQMKLPLQYTMK